jgi:hypothetical protein
MKPGPHRRWVWLLLLTAPLATSRCATLAAPASEPPSAEAQLQWALALLHRQQFAPARFELERVYGPLADEPAARNALLVGAAVELDPRNPDRWPEAGAALAAQHLRLADTEPWTDPVAATLYLLALELGARPVTAGADGGGSLLTGFGRPATPLPVSDAERARRREWVEDMLASRPQRALPRLPLERHATDPDSLPAAATPDAPLLTARVHELEEHNAAFRERLQQAQDSIAVLNRELDRIRRAVLGTP